MGVSRRPVARPALGLLVAAVALVACAFSAPPVLAAPASENDVKAVFLFNFTQFVSWPPAAFATQDAPFVIGVLGHDSLGDALDAAVRGEHVGDHPIVVRRYRSAADVIHCQLLFVDRSESARLQAILQAIGTQPMLTVSDADRAAPLGVMIGFVVEDRHVRLQINRDAAEATGLTISSKLLRPSQIVTRNGG